VPDHVPHWQCGRQLGSLLIGGFLRDRTDAWPHRLPVWRHRLQPFSLRGELQCVWRALATANSAAFAWRFLRDAHLLIGNVSQMIDCGSTLALAKGVVRLAQVSPASFNSSSARLVTWGCFVRCRNCYALR